MTSKTKKIESETINNEQGEATAEPKEKEVKAPRKRATTKKTEEKKDEEKAEKKPRAPRAPRVKKEKIEKTEAEQPVVVAEAPVAEVAVVELTETEIVVEDDEDEQETQAEEAAEETKIGRPLTRQEKQEMRRNRQQRRKAARERNDNEDYKKAEEPDYPKMVQCFFHPEEVLAVADNPAENQAYSPNGVLVIALSEIRLPGGDKRQMVVALMKKLRPNYFNRDCQPPAVCRATLSKIESGMMLMRPLLSKDNPAMREPLSFTYKDGYIKWYKWAGKREKEMAEGSWAVWDKIINEHHPEFKNERNAQTMAGELSQECMDALRVELMEKTRKFRGSEAWQLLRQIHEINRELVEQQMIKEMEDRARDAKEKKEQMVDGVVEDLSDLVSMAPEIAPSEEHEERATTTEWLRKLVLGKLTTADITLSWGGLEQFRNEPGREVRSDNPNCEEVGTQKTTYGKENKPLFRTVVVPVRVADRDGKMKKAEGGGKFWVPRIAILTAREAWEATEIRRTSIIEQLKKDPSITDAQADELCELSQDQHDSWRDGKLAIGKLWQMTLEKRISKYIEKNPDGPQVRSAIQRRNPRGTHGGFEGGQGHNEASEAETRAFLDGQPVEQISAKPRLKSNGG